LALSISNKFDAAIGGAQHDFELGTAGAGVLRSGHSLSAVSVRTVKNKLLVGVSVSAGDRQLPVRRVQPAHPHHVVTIAATERLLLASEVLYVTLQNLTEAWRVMTSPRGANGLGFGISGAQAELDRIGRLFALLAEDVPTVAARRSS